MPKFSCPHCQQKISSEHDTLGIAVTCPSCKTDFQVEDEINIEPSMAVEPRSRRQSLKVIALVAGGLAIVFLAFKLAEIDPPNTEQAEKKTVGKTQKNPDQQQAVVSEVYNLYMGGYRDPNSAEMGRRLLELRPDRLSTPGGQMDRIMVEGADDRLAGRQPRYTLIRR